MKRKMKKRITQGRRHQRSIYEMLNRDRPIGATHFDVKHKVYYKQENGQWFYFDSVWLDDWVPVQQKSVMANVREIEVLV